MMILQAVRAYARPELLERLIPGVYDGTVRFAMGYTEPGGGSDIATCRTRARRVGDDWVINGQKMFTTGAHNCQYIFLLTNTEPDGGRHRDLTMFLVPTDTPGIEIHGLRTVDCERTNCLRNIPAVSFVVHEALVDSNIAHRVIDVGSRPRGASDDCNFAGQRVGAAQTVNRPRIRTAKNRQDNLITYFGISWQIAG